VIIRAGNLDGNVFNDTLLSVLLALNTDFSNLLIPILLIVSEVFSQGTSGRAQAFYACPIPDRSSDLNFHRYFI
jgi:hypothetical protein